MLNAHAVHKRARRVLPEVLATSGVVLEEESEAGLAALLFPLRRPSSGAISFRLCRDSAQALRADPMVFLRTARVARASLDVGGAPAQYRQWRQVMLPFGPVYFTARHDGRGLIVIEPEEGRVVYLWQDH
ncbi:MAG: hypothetical protein QM769_08185 [Pseudoxanthomonas sp.]